MYRFTYLHTCMCVSIDLCMIPMMECMELDGHYREQRDTCQWLCTYVHTLFHLRVSTSDLAAGPIGEHSLLVRTATAISQSTG